MPTTRKRTHPPDATLRNLRANAKRLARVNDRLRRLEHAVRELKTAIALMAARD